jgi:hypothetical protein
MLLIRPRRGNGCETGWHAPAVPFDLKLGNIHDARSSRS